MANPCFNCPDRHARCHTECEAYKGYRAEKDAEIERKYKYIAETENLRHVRRRRRKE